MTQVGMSDFVIKCVHWGKVVPFKSNDFNCCWLSNVVIGHRDFMENYADTRDLGFSWQVIRNGKSHSIYIK